MFFRRATKHLQGLQLYGIRLNLSRNSADFVLVTSRNGNQKFTHCCVSYYALCRVNKEGAVMQFVDCTILLLSLVNVTRISILKLTL